MSKKLFEAFFSVEATRPNSKSPFNSTNYIWHYPDDVTEITKEFNNIPLFCFPDLEKISLERIEASKSEHFNFTLTDKNGNRVYGVCMRTLFRGQGKIYDTSRKARHCLCFITKSPNFQVLRTILQQLHGLMLLEDHDEIISSKVSNDGSKSNYIETIIGREFLAAISLQGIGDKSSGKIRIPRNALPVLNRDFTISIPRNSNVSNNVSIFGLLEKLGVETFMFLLSAILCERRIIFIADEVDLLSSSVLAAESMLCPFIWQHILIPLLPSQLLSYASAPVPYIIGVRRYLLPALANESIDDVIIVDLDLGECKIHGDVTIVDFVGESNTITKHGFDQVSDQMKHAGHMASKIFTKASGLASMFLKNSNKTTSVYNKDSDEVISRLDGTEKNLSSGSGKGIQKNSSKVGHKDKDMVTSILYDLKQALSNKPDRQSVVLLSSRLLRKLPGGVSTVTIQEEIEQWEMESEKILRDCLMQFFVYLFADMVVSKQRVTEMETCKDINSNDYDLFSNKDFRYPFKLDVYISNRSNSQGDSNALTNFLLTFIHSQMFERFCLDRLRKILKREDPTFVIPSLKASDEAVEVGFEQDDDFDAIVLNLQFNNLATTVANVKEAVTNRSNIENKMNIDDSKSIGSEFHPSVLQMTLGMNNLISGNDLAAKSGMRTSLKHSMEVSQRLENFIDSNIASFENEFGIAASPTSVEINDNNHSGISFMPSSLSQIIVKICVDASNTLFFPKIMRTIKMRLERCKASGCRGSSGTKGLRAMILLRYLLICGPECVLSVSLDFIPILRSVIAIINLTTKINKSTINRQSAAQALEFMQLGAMCDVYPYAKGVLTLLLDHKQLALQRRYSMHATDGLFPYLLLANQSKAHMQMTRQDLFVQQGFGLKAFPTFGGLDGLHLSMKGPGCNPIDPKLVKVTLQRQCSSRNLLEDEYEDDELPSDFSTLNMNISQLKTDRPISMNVFNPNTVEREKSSITNESKSVKNVTNSPIKKSVPLLVKPSLSATKLDPPPTSNFISLSNGTNNKSVTLDLMNFDDDVVVTNNNVNNIPINDPFAGNNMDKFDPFTSSTTNDFNIDWGDSSITSIDPFAGFVASSPTNTTSLSSFTPSISGTVNIFPPTPPSDYDPFEGLDNDSFTPSISTNTFSTNSNNINIIDNTSNIVYNTNDTLNNTNVNNSINLATMKAAPIKPPKASTNPFLKANPLNYQKPIQNNDPFASLSSIQPQNASIHHQQVLQRQQLEQKRN